MAGAALAWAGYLAWLGAGCADFLCHRRSDLPHTSGLAESGLHLLQLMLIGVAILAWLALLPSLATLAVQCALLLAHAVAGYVDTRVAWRRRPIVPLEQHLHSVLDLAPWIAFGVLVHVEAEAAAARGWRIDARDPPLAAATWTAVLLPALALCVLPALREAWLAWRARRPPAAQQQA